MGVLHINGQKATGVNIILAEGVFMDADNLIFSYSINSGSISQTEYSYTATEDCYVRFMTCTPSANQITKILIDDAEIFRIQNTSADEIFSDICLLKKGQVITFSNIGAYTNIGVYGIQPGTIEVYAHHYSTDEKVVGTWIDGSTLYEKTYDLGQDVTIKYNEWTEVNATKPNGILKYINIFGTQDDGTGVVLTGANPANITYSNIRLSTRRFQDESVRWFTIQYTKSS